ncbi:HipA family kinase [Caldimonas sp. KR1-144]|uniref:HipA family kinase n=1 Tax=Caldimonas sp. KR1-144 TaxID=3400911 RepID=UPI003C0974A0
MRTVTATQYLTPLREGGSLPAVVAADDDGLYVVKFRGAGQGRKALIAELVAGELARAVGLPVPEIVLVELDAELARTEPDPEIQDLIRASAGLNLALDYLPGSVTFDPLAHTVDAALASRIVWHDAFVSNVDRSARNTNLLVWHRGLWLIDHGASLIFHHDWRGYMERSSGAFPMIKDHVLLPAAAQLAEADAEMSARLNDEAIERIVALIPEAWLADEPAFANAAEHREAYRRYFINRLRQPHAFVEEAVRARSLHL